MDTLLLHALPSPRLIEETTISLTLHHLHIYRKARPSGNSVGSGADPHLRPNHHVGSPHRYPILLPAPTGPLSNCAVSVAAITDFGGLREPVVRPSQQRVIMIMHCHPCTHYPPTHLHPAWCCSAPRGPG